MPFSRSRAGICLLATMSLALLAAIPAQAAPRKAASPAPAAVAVNVELTHQLGADKGAELARIVQRFNAQSKIGQISVAERSWSQGSPALLSIVAETEEADFIAGGRRIKPLWQVMKDAGVKMQTLPVPRFMVPASLDGRGRLQALPVGLSTPVVFFNKNALTKAGVTEAPVSWNAWQEVLSALWSSGQACPMTISQPASTLLENASAWNNQAFVTGGKNEQIAVNGLIQVKHIAKLSSWYKARFLHYFGRANEGEERFASGECAVLIAPSAAFPTLVRMTGFPIGVSSYPYHDDAYGAPQNTWADGPA